MKKIISTLILTTFLISSCSKKEEIVDDTSSQIKYVKTQILSKKTFKEDFKLTGKVSGVNETSISTQVSGLVKNINYKIGDKVKTGDILASIDTQTNLSNINLNNANSVYNNTLNVYNLTKESIQKDLETSKLQYENALTAKQNTYDTTQKQLEIAQAQLDSVITQKDNTQQTSQTTLSISKETLENAKLNLENFEKNYSETIKSLENKKKSIIDKKSGLIDTIKATIDTGLASIDNGLSGVDVILGVTDLNKSINDNYEIYLSAKNLTYKYDAETKFNEVNALFKDYKKNYNKDLSDEEILKYYEKLLIIGDKTVALYDKMTEVLDNTLVNQSLSETSLLALKSTNKVNQTGILTLKSTLVGLNNTLTDLENSLVDIDNTISSTQTSLSTQKLTLEQSIKIAQASLDNTVSSTNTSLDTIKSTNTTTKLQLENTLASIKASREIADNSLKIAQNQLDSAKAKYDSQLASTKSQLDSANGQKNSASQQVANSQIKAPFDGIITSRNIEIGSLVNPGNIIFSISNDSKKIVKIDVSSDNINFISKGKEVNIEKNGNTYTGTVSVVGGSSDATTKLFKVEINFSSIDLDLNLGDYVDVFITKKDTKEEYIIVPFSSVIAGNNENHTILLVGSGNIIEEKKIKTGASNSHEVIIKSGVKEGDKIVIEGTLDIQAGDIVSER